MCRRCETRASSVRTSIRLARTHLAHVTSQARLSTRCGTTLSRMVTVVSWITGPYSCSSAILSDSLLTVAYSSCTASKRSPISPRDPGMGAALSAAYRLVFFVEVSLSIEHPLRTPPPDKPWARPTRTWVRTVHSAILRLAGVLQARGHHEQTACCGSPRLGKGRNRQPAGAPAKLGSTAPLPWHPGCTLPSGLGLARPTLLA